jgi:hypothetical protein
MNVIDIIPIIFGLLFIIAGLNNLRKYMNSPENYNKNKLVIILWFVVGIWLIIIVVPLF